MEHEVTIDHFRESIQPKAIVFQPKAIVFFGRDLSSRLFAGSWWRKRYNRMQRGGHISVRPICLFGAKGELLHERERNQRLNNSVGEGGTRDDHDPFQRIHSAKQLYCIPFWPAYQPVGGGPKYVMRAHEQRAKAWPILRNGEDTTRRVWRPASSLHVFSLWCCVMVEAGKASGREPGRNVGSSSPPSSLSIRSNTVALVCTDDGQGGSAVELSDDMLRTAAAQPRELVRETAAEARRESASTAAASFSSQLSANWRRTSAASSIDRSSVGVCGR
mmetsp:Transcript_52595/g.161892  ORF Transcript_52595/g.161892 Transcript_52595/m.161892 type:complete len:275 (-) Transcript_52595:114-938(-)